MKKLLSLVIALTAALGFSAYAEPVLDTAEDANGNAEVDYAVLADATEENLAELAEVSELKWDFETEDSQTWSKRRYNTTYKNGIMYLDSSVVESSNNYIGHETLSSEDITNTDVLNYLVVKARSLGAVSNIKFYFSTSDYGYAVNGTETYVNIPLIPNGSIFEEYIVDMSAHERWSGNYKGCMFQLSGSSGIVEIEEIKFVSEYVPETDMYHEYHIDITNTSHFTAWGHSYADVNDDGTVNFGKKILYIIPNYDKGQTATHYYDEATDSYVLITTDNPMPEGATGYKIQNEGAVYIYPRAALNASHYNKLVVKAKGGNVDSIKTYYSTTGYPGYAETTKTMSVGPTTGADGFSYYIFDYSKKTNYSGTVKEFMVALNNYGETVIHDIYLTNDANVAANLSSNTYSWDFEGLSTVDEGKNVGISAWSGHTSVAFDGNNMVITRSTAGGSGGIDVTPQTKLASADYPYLVAKVKKPENGATIEFNTYYVTGTMSSIAGGKEVKATKVDFADDKYDYYLTDFSGAADFSLGNLKKVVFTTSSAGTWYVEELIMTSDLSFIGIEKDVPSERVVKTYLNGDAEIKEENGTVTLTPYILYADSSDEKDLSGVTYVGGSDDVATVTNVKGIATVSAVKYNGTTDVTAQFPNGTTITKTVVVSGQAPVYTVVYDAGTDDEVTGMPKAVTVQTWDSTFTVSDAKPERAGYKFAGWSAVQNTNYVLDTYAYQGDTTTMYAIWIDENTGLFHINKDEHSGKSVYVNGSLMNSSDCMTYGGSLFVPLTDGIGYVLVGETAYKVTADTCEALDYVPAKTLPGNEARATGDTGIRFKASVAHAMRNEGNIAEYGFVVSTANQISDGDLLDISLVDSGDAVKGIAYSKAANIDKYHEETDEGVIMAAVLTGVAESKANYTTTIYVRPYMVLDSGLEIYGHATSATYYDIAKTIAADMPEDAPYAAYINGIISTVEAE